MFFFKFTNQLLGFMSWANCIDIEIGASTEVLILSMGQERTNVTLQVEVVISVRLHVGSVAVCEQVRQIT